MHFVRFPSETKQCVAYWSDIDPADMQRFDGEHPSAFERADVSGENGHGGTDAAVRAPHVWSELFVSIYKAPSSDLTRQTKLDSTGGRLDGIVAHGALVQRLRPPDCTNCACATRPRRASYWRT